jgi:hypothetical protein
MSDFEAATKSGCHCGRRPTPLFPPLCPEQVNLAIFSLCTHLSRTALHRTASQVTKLMLDSATAAGSSVTFSLLSDSACPTLESLLASPAYAVFNKKQSCCPTWALDVSMVP